ncbi:MAG: hypothetical protein J1F32_04380 [Erysipelotrichales bacterium]|nr:hypothetical protein [Erysipelotrichales bacterium]
MSEINEIRKRINKPNKHNRLYILCISALLLMAIVMGTMIYAKSNADAKIFGVPLAEINHKFDSFFGGLFKSNVTSKDDDQTVGATPKYTYLGNNYYQSEDQSVPALIDGIVNNVTENDSGYYVLVSYKNGVTAQYFELTDVIVKVNDNIKTSDSIGIYEEKFKALFMRGNDVIKYAEIFN